LPIRTLAQIIAWSLAAAIIVLSVVPPGLRPQTVAPHQLEHLAIFAAAGFAFGLGFDQKRSLLAIYLVVFAGFIEFLQLFVPGRHARLSDFVVDAASIFGGLVTEYVVGQIYSRYSRL
jgi:VanZ family protein